MSQWPSPKLGTVEEVFTARLHWKESKDVSEGGREGDKDLKYCDYSISSHLHHPPIWHTYTHTHTHNTHSLVATSVMSRRTWWTVPPPLTTPQCATSPTPPRPSLRRSLKIWWVSYSTIACSIVGVSYACSNLSLYSRLFLLLFFPLTPSHPPPLTHPPGSSGGGGLPHAPGRPWWFRLWVSPSRLCKFVAYIVLWLLVTMVTVNVNTTICSNYGRGSLSGFNQI